MYVKELVIVTNPTKDPLNSAELIVLVYVLFLFTLITLRKPCFKWQAAVFSVNTLADSTLNVQHHGQLMLLKSHIFSAKVCGEQNRAEVKRIFYFH